MNKFFLFSALCAFGFFTQEVACAQPTSAQAAESSAKALGIKEPCPVLRDACKNAGFVGNDIWLKCVKDATEGKTVANLKTTNQDVSSCKSELENLPCMQILQGCQNAGYNSSGPGKLTLFDCVFPVVEGKQVANVKLKVSDISSCKTFLDKVLQIQPCLRVMIACRKAGFSPDMVNGSRFATQCLVPITEGKKVQGVTIDTQTASECYARMHPTAVPSQPTQQISY